MRVQSPLAHVRRTKFARRCFFIRQTVSRNPYRIYSHTSRVQKYIAKALHNERDRGGVVDGRGDINLRIVPRADLAFVDLLSRKGFCKPAKYTYAYAYAQNW
jgi:hypothetical protein